MKQYKIAEPINNAAIAAFAELEPVILQLLWNRGLRTQSDIDAYLHPEWSRDVHSPYLFQDMNLAVERIYESLGRGDTIGVFGDYDADGVSAAVIITSTLDKLGAKTRIYLPHREREGYGLNKNALTYLQQQGASLIITCDCGISNIEQIEFANSLGLDVIVTDHHQAPDKLPPAYAIIHCGLTQETYPFKFLSGGGVAFKLMQGVLRYPGCPLAPPEGEAWEKWLLDLVAISTVADMVPLVGESRTLTKYGLVVLNKTRRLGLAKLISQAGLVAGKLDAYSIGFQIAPRINAAGRLDHANAAYSLLTSENESEAENLARSLNLTNIERQRLTDEMFLQAKEQIGAAVTDKYSVHAFKSDWPLGMVGLVAGKLAQEYNLPALVICQAGDKVAGSGRSIAQFDLVQALNECKDFLLNYGGHKGAAGFTLAVEKLETFLQKFESVCARLLKDTNLTPVLVIDAELKLAQLDLSLVEAVSKLEPYGMANPKPRFLTAGLQLLESQTVGSNGQHLRLTARDEAGEIKKFIYFNGTVKFKNEFNDRVIDITYELGQNEWGGRRELELKVVDIRENRDKL